MMKSVTERVDSGSRLIGRSTSILRHGSWTAMLLLGLGTWPAPAAEEDSIRELHARARWSVFLVEGGAAAGSGFLVDRSGLIVTSHHLVESAASVFITVTPGQVFATQVLLLDRALNIAILRAHPLAVAEREPLRLLDEEKEEQLPVEGDTAVAIGCAMCRPAEAHTVILRKVGRSGICYRASIPAAFSGGPLLNREGEVIGVLGAGYAGRARTGDSCSVPIQRLTAALLEARATASDMDPVMAVSLSEPSIDNYPHEALDLHPKASNSSAYRMRAGKVNVGFLTPPLIHSLANDPDPVFEPRDDFFVSWRYADAHRPVVTVQVLPDLRWTAGSAFLVVGYPLYIISLPFQWLFFPLFGSPPPEFLPPPRASYRFKRDFNGIQLLRKGVEVVPTYSSVVCEPNWLMVARNQDQKAKLRKVRGCFGVSRYPPQAFEPGVPLAVRIFEGGTPAKEGDVPIDPALVQRVWDDFAPYFDAIRQRAGGTAPVP